MYVCAPVLIPAFLEFTVKWEWRWRQVISMETDREGKKRGWAGAEHIHAWGSTSSLALERGQ